MMETRHEIKQKKRRRGFLRCNKLTIQRIEYLNRPEFGTPNCIKSNIPSTPSSYVACCASF